MQLKQHWLSWDAAEAAPEHQELLDPALNLQKNTLPGYSRDPEQICVFCLVFTVDIIRKVKFIHSWFCFNLMHPW